MSQMADSSTALDNTSLAVRSNNDSDSDGAANNCDKNHRACVDSLANDVTISGGCSSFIRRLRNGFNRLSRSLRNRWNSHEFLPHGFVRANTYCSDGIQLSSGLTRQISRRQPSDVVQVPLKDHSLVVVGTGHRKPADCGVSLI